MTSDITQAFTDLSEYSTGNNFVQMCVQATHPVTFLPDMAHLSSGYIFSKSTENGNIQFTSTTIQIFIYIKESKSSTSSA